MKLHLKFLQKSSYKKRNEWSQCVITAGKQKHAQNIGLQAFLQKLCGNGVGGGVLAWCILAADDSLGQLGKNQGFQPGSTVWSTSLSLALVSILSSVLPEMFIVYFVLVYFKCLFVLERKISFYGPYCRGSDFVTFLSASHVTLGMHYLFTQLFVNLEYLSLFQSLSFCLCYAEDATFFLFL